MGFEQPLRWDELFERVKEALAGKRFDRLPWYSPSEKVLMVVSAGDGAAALNDLLARIRDNGDKLLRGSEADKEEVTRKIMQAVETYLTAPRG
jgi:hypothetical protein